MRKYALRRLVSAVPTLFGITVLIFVAMRVLPGDPVAMIASEGQGTYALRAEELAKARATLGLDKPYYLQYLDWMGEVLRGDLGRSFWRGEPIRDLILRRGPITAQIALMAVCLSWVIGIPSVSPARCRAARSATTSPESSSRSSWPCRASGSDS